MVPFRAPFSTVSEILKNSAESRDTFVDYRPGFLELAPEDALEKYQLVPTLKGDNDVTSTRIVDEVLILDRGSEEVYSSFQVDELAEDYYVEQLTEIDSIDRSLAEELINEYGNLRTVSWAVSRDTEFFEDTFGLDSKEIFKELGEAGVYRNEESPEAGVLHFSERRADESGESDEDDETGSVQTGF